MTTRPTGDQPQTLEGGVEAYTSTATPVVESRSNEWLGVHSALGEAMLKYAMEHDIDAELLQPILLEPMQYRSEEIARQNITKAIKKEPVDKVWQLPDWLGFLNRVVGYNYSKNDEVKEAQETENGYQELQSLDAIKQIERRIGILKRKADEAPVSTASISFPLISWLCEHETFRGIAYPFHKAVQTVIDGIATEQAERSAGGQRMSSRDGTYRSGNTWASALGSHPNNNIYVLMNGLGTPVTTKSGAIIGQSDAGENWWNGEHEFLIPLDYEGLRRFEFTEAPVAKGGADLKMKYWIQCPDVECAIGGDNMQKVSTRQAWSMYRGTNVGRGDPRPLKCTRHNQNLNLLKGTAKDAVTNAAREGAAKMQEHLKQYDSRFIKVDPDLN